MKSEFSISVEKSDVHFSLGCVAYSVGPERRLSPQPPQPVVLTLTLWLHNWPHNWDEWLKFSQPGMRCEIVSTSQSLCLAPLLPGPLLYRFYYDCHLLQLGGSLQGVLFSSATAMSAAFRAWDLCSPWKPPSCFWGVLTVSVSRTARFSEVPRTTSCIPGRWWDSSICICFPE